ncbi:MAG: RagB/SusD family nutrient uptake outer membrane protein, partial [Bacteroidales bacterium]
MSSCTGFLDEESNPNYLTPSTFWKSEGDIKKGLTSAYARLQPSMGWGAPYERFIVLDNYRSDELDFRADVPEWSRLAMFANTPNDWSCCMGEWSNLYKGINYSNQCIDNIPNVPEVSDEVKNRSLAEARFLRAYYYYRLYMNFGEIIPLYEHEIKGSEEEFYPKQAEAGVVVAFIEKELIDVQKYLPEPEFWASMNEHGRATKYMAAGILAKFYMFRNQLDKAEVELSKIIESGKFGLLDNYADLWDGLHKNSEEAVFEIQFSGNNEGGRREFNRIALHLASFNAEGYEEAYPSAWLFETMKKDKTVDGKYSDRLYSTIIFNDSKTKPFYFGEGEKFTDWHGENEIFWHKFMTWDESLSDYWDWSAFNIPVIRYADVLLLYAECINQKGATGKAIDYINMVRDRANVAQLPRTMGKADVLKHLQEVERPCELALEGARWYDLVRWGIVSQSLKAHNKPYAENYVDTKHKLMPIPH